MDPNAVYEGAPILVTGASGFIGEHLCRRLSDLGAHVTGVYFKNRPNGSHADWRRVDLTDLRAVRDQVNATKPVFIFHLASYVVGRRELDAVLPTFESNLASTVYLMIAAQEAGCCERLVLTNSVEEPDRGDPNAVPSSPYAASKFAASAYARMFHALYGLPTVIARVFMVYGPDQKDRRKLVPYTILRALEGEAPELSSGTRKIDWIYVDDVVDGLLRLGNKPGLEGETIELGSGVSHTVREVVEEILRQIDPTLEGRFGAIPDRAMEQERLAKVDEARAMADWEAEIALEEGLRRTIEWYAAERKRST
jgi:nucleoside-diphosphate-sugar epimerase